jgi:hypothetical protein
MEHAARRPMLTLATLTTAGALALSPMAVAPPELHAPDLSAARISTQAVQLTDAWSDLLNDTLGSVVQLGGLFLGADNNFPLPSPTIPLAPVATQLVLNQLIYLGQLFTGQGAQIPTEIATHLTNVVLLARGLANELPAIIVQQLQTPFVAAKLAIESVTLSGNLLLALLEAPAVLLNFALNSQYGLIGINGPIAIPIIVRNALAKIIDPPLPTWLSHILQPGKAVAAAPVSAASTVALKVTPSQTAGSARSKPKAPASSSRKASPSAKASSSSAGSGHSKRG